MGNSFRQPYGLPPSRAVETALRLFPRICCASAREPYILPLRLAADVPSDSNPPSRAVETALGQEMARSMCHFQVRKWQRAHRALCKKALAHPSTPPQKNTTSFFGDPVGGAYNEEKDKKRTCETLSAFDRCLLSPWLLSARRLPSRRNNRSSCRRGAQPSARGSAGTRQASEPLPYSLQNACSFCSWTVFPWGLP